MKVVVGKKTHFRVCQELYLIGLDHPIFGVATSS
ncbi:hypothetical protein SCG7086_AE_00310 [Chlamydiales bacterium SCGC AG-110-P3]|nr:hypothetical protein SCG7086_AE_00310 [Chlamydiales bacterium SCGC AG-110-P3]